MGAGDPIDQALAPLVPSMRGPAWELIKYAVERLGHDVAIVQSRRTCAEQTALYEQGISPVKGCKSWHVHGRAMDLMLDDYNASPEAYEKLGAQWELFGGTWGGRFPDPDLGHFEWREGKSLAALCAELGPDCSGLGVHPLPSSVPRFAYVGAPSTATIAALAFVGGAVVPLAGVAIRRALRQQPKWWWSLDAAAAGAAMVAAAVVLDELRHT